MVQHDATQAALTGGTRPASQWHRSTPWAIAELVIAIAVLFASMRGYFGELAFLTTVLLLAIGTAFLWLRGPGWRAIGLRAPERWRVALAIGAALSLYQFVSLYAIEPAVARLTTGELPDVSLFRPVVGNEGQLLFWLSISWTLAAFVEELVFRGWLTARVAELAGDSSRAWTVGVLLSSIIFGLAHVYQGASGVITTGLNGFLFGAAYLLSGRNLWCAIVAHGLTDSIAFMMIYFGVYPGITS